MRFDSVFGPITLASRARKGTLMAGVSLSRRRVLKTLGVASIAAGFPYIKTSRSAGRLALETNGVSHVIFMNNKLFSTVAV